LDDRRDRPPAPAAGRAGRQKRGSNGVDKKPPGDGGLTHKRRRHFTGRSELVALNVGGLVDAGDGFRVLTRHSKTDQKEQGQAIATLRGSRQRRVEAVREWLAAAGIAEGPFLRRVKTGRVGSAGVSARIVADLVKQYAESAGLDPADFTGHSLRAGFLTRAAESGPPFSR